MCPALSFSQRSGNLTDQSFRQHMVAFRGQVLSIRLMRQSVQHAATKHHHFDAHSAQFTLYLRSLVPRSFSPVVSTGLQDHDAGSFWHDPVQPSQHSTRSVAVDTGIDNVNAQTLAAEQRFQLRWIGLTAGNSLAKGIARSQRHDGSGKRRIADQQQSNRAEKCKTELCRQVRRDAHAIPLIRNRIKFAMTRSGKHP